MEQKSTLVWLICFSYLVCFRSNRKYTNNKAISSISRGIHCDIRKENSRRTKRKQQLERAAYEINTHIEHRVPTAENCNKCNRYSLETMTSAMADSTWTHFMASKSKKMLHNKVIRIKFPAHIRPAQDILNQRNTHICIAYVAVDSISEN